MRKSDVFLASMVILLALGSVALLQAALDRGAVNRSIELRSALVRHLALTDLCLFTEARYTRHPSQADIHTPFQDHPLSLEHFPSGSIVPPPVRFERGR